MIEQRSFRIHELADLDAVGDLLDEAFAEGWQYTSHFGVGRAAVVVLSRVKRAEELTAETAHNGHVSEKVLEKRQPVRQKAAAK